MNDFPLQEIEGFDRLLTDKAKEVYEAHVSLTAIKAIDHYLTTLGFCKPVPLGKAGEIPPEYIERMAYAFNELVADDAIAHGMCVKASWMELARIDAKRRALLMFYTYPGPKVTEQSSDPAEQREIITGMLGNDAFPAEGGIGSNDWDSLGRAAESYNQAIIAPDRVDLDALATRHGLLRGMIEWLLSVVATRFDREQKHTSKIALDPVAFAALFADTIWYQTKGIVDRGMGLEQGKPAPKIHVITCQECGQSPRETCTAVAVEIETPTGSTIIHPTSQAKPKRRWWRFWRR